MEQKDVNKLNRVSKYLEESTTMQKLMRQYMIVIAYEGKSYCVNDEMQLAYKLFVTIEKGKDDAYNFNYLVSCYNESNYKQMNKEQLKLKKSEYKRLSEDAVIVKSLEKVCRLFSKDYD